MKKTIFQNIMKKHETGLDGNRKPVKQVFQRRVSVKIYQPAKRAIEILCNIRIVGFRSVMEGPRTGQSKRAGLIQLT